MGPQFEFDLHRQLENLWAQAQKNRGGLTGLEQSMAELNGKSLLVTGGGSGLGAGIAKYFCERGARVTISGRRAHKLEAVAGALGANCQVSVGDVTNAADREQMIETAVRHGDGLDVLVNNAGNMYQGPLTELDEDLLNAVFHSNVTAAMMLSGLAVPHLEQSQGSIVFMGSVHTRRAYPGASPYAATKGAVEVLSKVLAAELGEKKIRVNCILPGAVPTEINLRANVCTPEELDARMKYIASSHALGRIGTEEEIAQAVAYLTCAAWTTGASLAVDGGLSLGVSRLI